MKYSPVSKEGRVVIPAAMRTKYGFKKGIRVAFLEEGGKLFLEPVDKKYFDRFAGILGTKGKALKSLMEDKKREREL